MKTYKEFIGENDPVPSISYELQLELERAYEQNSIEELEEDLFLESGFKTGIAGIALFSKYRNRLKQDISMDEKLVALADIIAVSVVLNRSELKRAFSNSKLKKFLK